MKRIAIVGLLCLAMGMPLAAAAPDNPLIGVWKVDGGHAGLTGIYMFTDTFYSMVAATADRPDIADISKATADQLRAIWGPVLANAGVYEIAGDLPDDPPCRSQVPGGDEIGCV